MTETSSGPPDYLAPLREMLERQRDDAKQAFDRAQGERCAYIETHHPARDLTGWRRWVVETWLVIQFPVKGRFPGDEEWARLEESVAAAEDRWGEADWDISRLGRYGKRIAQLHERALAREADNPQVAEGDAPHGPVVTFSQGPTEEGSES